MDNRKLAISICLIGLLSSLPYFPITNPQASMDNENSYLRQKPLFHKISSYNNNVISSSEYPFATHYPTVQELYTWYNTLENSSICQKIQIGSTWEDRPLYILKISDNVEKNEEEPEVLIDGTIHAREWPSLQAASYFLWKLVTSYDTDPTIHWLVNHREIFMMPMVNPDGYYYDGNGKVAKSPGTYGWRKNARDNNQNGEFDPYIDGVDLNRNWNIDWGQRGASHQQSDSTYCGPNPFSEPETNNYSQWILSHDIESYQNLHCFGGSLLLPWTFTHNPAPHAKWYQAMAADMTTLTSIMGNETKKYSYGQPYEEIGYRASGGAYDWVYNYTGALSLSFEIATGGNLFHPPTDTIMTINRNIFEACLYQARIANTELGNSTTNLYPPKPYLLYGTLTGPSKEAKQTKITLTNMNTQETITTTTDKHGYYEFNFATFQRHGYLNNHTFNLTVVNTSDVFTIGSEWGQQRDISLTTESKQPFYITHRKLVVYMCIIGITVVLTIGALIFYSMKQNRK